jgi:hypothetical protein
MSDIFQKIEPETSGHVTQLDVGHSDDIVLKVSLVLVIGLVISGFNWWLFNQRNGDPKSKLKLVSSKFNSLFKNEWIWRLFLVLQIGGIIGITCLAIIDDNNWKLLPYTSWSNEMAWDFFDSWYWTHYHENWFVIAFLFSPFLISKAADWIFAAKNKTSPADVWKRN